MIVESKYCAHIIKKMNKEFVITKKGNEGFQNFTKYWNYDHVYVKADVKKRGNCHISGKYKGSIHRDYKLTLS